MATTEVPEVKEGLQVSPGIGIGGFWAVLRSRILLGIAGISLILLTAVICYDVICRYFLQAPSRWGYEVSTYLMAASVLFGAAHTLSIGAHIRVDIVYMQLRGRRQALADALAWLVGAVFCGTLTWLSAVLALRSFHNGAKSMDLSLPLAVPQAFVTLGALALLLESLVLLAGAIRRIRGESE